MKQFAFLESALPVEDPLIAVEGTDDGWRGLTSKGLILNVKSSNGHRAQPPTGNIIVTENGMPKAWRPVETNDVSIADYLLHFNAANSLSAMCRPQEALAAINTAMSIAPTILGRYNRAQILLALGQWEEGFAEYAECERDPAFERAGTRTALAAGLRRWRGEPLADRDLLLIHDHGIGDSIQMLRYVPRLRAMGARVTLWMPPEMKRLAQQCARVVSEPVDCDFFCPIFQLIGLLKVAPESVAPDTYLAPNLDEVAFWRDRFAANRKTIGVVWSVGRYIDGEYPREIPLSLLVDKFGRDAHLVSLQSQGAEEAEAHGVEHIPFADLDDVATAMTAVDQIVSVDTAALHLAGALGHPNVIGLLSYWHSWRWQARWYWTPRLVQQSAPNDWESALAQI